MPARGVLERALPVDPGLDFVDPQRSRAGRFVHIRSAGGETKEDDELEATVQAGQSDSPAGRVAYSLRRVLIGPPLRSTAIAEERMGRLLALAVLSPDALSSVAYGPEAMMAILVLAGASELKLSLPIGAALAVLMLSVGLGYRQVIRAYPHGGGSYIVASDSLGPQWGLLAAAGLIVDYILTVAVSVAAGVAAVTSAIPSVASATVPIGLVVIMLLVAGNLRGVRDSAAALCRPDLPVRGGNRADRDRRSDQGRVARISSRASGASPGDRDARRAARAARVRVRSDGDDRDRGDIQRGPGFRPPEAKHARQTLGVMIGLLISMFAGVVLVAHFDGAAPSSSQTVLSQIAHSSVGSGIAYGFVQVATTLVLLVAANSAFNGFPRLLYFIARDGFAPRVFLRMGDRLAFTNGILVLAVPAALIYAAFGGQTSPLIPLFAIGVFLAFTLAQSGMVAHWWRRRERGWRAALATNLLGAVLSAMVVVIAAITKLTQGAWVVIVLVPLIVLACRRVHDHYQRAHEALTPRPETEDQMEPVRLAPPRLASVVSARLAEAQDNPSDVHSFAVVPIAALDLAALHALAYAVSLGQPVLAVHVSPTEQEAERFQRSWQAWGDHLPLEVARLPISRDSCATGQLHRRAAPPTP